MAKPLSRDKGKTIRYTLNKALDGHPNTELASFFAHTSTHGVESGLIEFAARVCYNSTAKLGTSPGFVRKVLDSGHLSVAEHPNIAVHFPVLLNKVIRQDYSHEFYNFFTTNRYFTLYNSYVVGNFRSWIDLISKKGIQYRNYEEIITALPEAFDTTPVFSDHVLDFDSFVNYINVPTYEDEHGLRVSMLAANVDLRHRKLGKTQSLALKKGDGLGRFTWLVEGVSRWLTHQVVRHRGSSISQESLRYVDATKRPMFIYPLGLTDSQRASFDSFNLESLEEYKILRASGVRKEDARYILPLSIATRLVISFDTPELVHFLRVRCAKDAQWEVRRMAQVMAQQAVLALPNSEIEEMLKWKED